MDWNAQNVTSSHPNAIVIIWMGWIEIQLQTCRLQGIYYMETCHNKSSPMKHHGGFCWKIHRSPVKRDHFEREGLVLFFQGANSLLVSRGGPIPKTSRPQGSWKFSTFPRHLCCECTAAWSWWCQGQMRCGFDGHVWCFRTQPFEIWGELPPWN